MTPTITPSLQAQLAEMIDTREEADRILQKTIKDTIYNLKEELRYAEEIQDALENNPHEFIEDKEIEDNLDYLIRDLGIPEYPLQDGAFDRLSAELKRVQDWIKGKIPEE